MTTFRKITLFRNFVTLVVDYWPFHAKNVTNQTHKEVFDSLSIVLICFRADGLTTEMFLGEANSE